MKRVYSRKLRICLALVIFQLVIISAKTTVRGAKLNTSQVLPEIEETPQTVFTLSSLNNKQLISSGTFTAEENEKLIIQITSTLEEGTADLFLFDPSGRQVEQLVLDKNETIEVVLTEGQWAYNCTGFWKDSGKIEVTFHIYNDLTCVASQVEPMQQML